MAVRFLDKKTHRFYFRDGDGDRKSYVLIFGDEVDTLSGAAPGGPDYRRVRYRGRIGEWKPPPLAAQRSLEMYFLDVGQGDAAFLVTPNNSKILVDGGLRDRALGFLIWKYRLDLPGNEVTINHLFLSHADGDHVEGLIPLLDHPRITVENIHHNGIAVFDSGFDEAIGNRTADGRLTTLHDGLADLAGLDLADKDPGDTFGEWIRAVGDSGAGYRMRHSGMGSIDIGDPALTLEILGPRLLPDGASLPWFGDKAHTINGNSLVFRLVHGFVRSFFSGDLNEDGSDYLLSAPGAALQVNAHVFKAPHHGSHEFSAQLFQAVKPMVAVVSSGEVPDHGHPRAVFLGAIGRAGRGPEPLLFSTALAALFTDAGDAAAQAAAAIEEPTTLGDLDFSKSASNSIARRRFKKILPGIINIRSDGQAFYAFRRVQQGYQWESYGPVAAIE
jgi:hypothetical protein